MYKEAIICIVAIVVIIWGNNMTFNYAKETMHKITQETQELRDTIAKENDEEINEEEANNKVNGIKKYWDEKRYNLAYFIEHDELEKAETTITEMKSYVEMEEHQEAVAQLDKLNYILYHIENKLAFKLENIL